MLAAAHGLDKVRPVISGLGAGRARGLFTAEKALVFAMVLIPHRKVTLRSVEDRAHGISWLGFIDASLMIGHPVPNLKHQDLFHATVVKFVVGGDGVRRL